VLQYRVHIVNMYIDLACICIIKCIYVFLDVYFDWDGEVLIIK
jgi:hypothetical protein